MRIQTEKRLRWGVLATLCWFFLSQAWKLVEDAIHGWINARIAEMSGMSDFSIQDAYPMLIVYGPAVFFMALAFGMVWGAYRLAWMGIPETTSNGTAFGRSLSPGKEGGATLDKQSERGRSPKIVILYDKIRDVERRSSGDGYNVKFRVYNDSDVRLEGGRVRIRTLEFFEGDRFKPYGHDLIDVPLSTREGGGEFDLPGGDEKSVYIATRGLEPGANIQLCYARPVPNTIPHKPAWRVGIRIIANNSPHKDATFELRVSADGSLVGTLLNDKETVNPIILAELETTVSPIGDFTPACAIRITNTGPELEGKCLVQIEKHGLEIHMPDPLTIRTEGQIRGTRTGRFTLSAGQTKVVPILYREPGHINHFRFIEEDGKHYSFTGDSAEFVVAIYGAATPTRVRIRLRVGEDWKVNSEMEYC